MPRRSFRKRRTRKRRSRKRRKPRISQSLIANKALVMMDYCDQISIQPDAFEPHLFRANSIFDPDFTGVGHQPLSHDQYALRYSQYRVVSTKITVTPLTDDGNNHIPCVWGLFEGTNSSVAYGTGEECIEDRLHTKNNWRMNMGNQTSSRHDGPLTATFNAVRDLSKQGAVNSVTFGQNPATTEDSFFLLWTANINSNVPSPIQFMVQIRYIVELSDPITLAQS